MQKPSEIQELDQQLEAASAVLKDLHTRALQLGVLDIANAAAHAIDALTDFKLARDEARRPKAKK